MSAALIVIDTNVLIAALRSSKGASHRLIRMVGTGKFELAVSVPLVLEYEAAAKQLTPLAARDIDAIIDYICSIAAHTRVHYLWRPILSDPGDDMVLELAVAGGCDAIITFNRSDFGEARRFGIRILAPSEFLDEIGGLP